MGSSSRAGFCLSDGDSSDSEHLPVIDFSQKPKNSVCSSSASSRPVSARPTGGNIFTVSSDSEDEEEEEAFIPLAVRLKQKALAKSKCGNQNGGTTEKTSAAQCGGVIEDDPAAVKTVSESASKSFSESASKSIHESASKPVSGRDENAGIRKRKRTLEEMEASRKEALYRRAEREKQHGERERLRVEKKTLMDAVKAMRPEECIKHMVVVVDPGEWCCSSRIFLTLLHGVMCYL